MLHVLAKVGWKIRSKTCNAHEDTDHGDDDNDGECGDDYNKVMSYCLISEMSPMKSLLSTFC